jgi:predicted NAD/FAD-dependent oxidoreductase
MGAKIAVIGAGLAGLACARELQNAGHRVVVYDKGRAPGGRIATRRVDEVAFEPDWFYQCDHGAQYFTIRDAAFAARIDDARRSATIAEWRPRWPEDTRERAVLNVATPGMSALGRWFAAGLDLRLATRIVALEREGEDWRLRDEVDSITERYSTVVLAIPAPQAVALAGPRLDPRIAAVTMLPCWAALLAYEAPIEFPIDADWRPDPVLPWIARDTSKPDRAGLDAWVLHASPDWTAARLHLSPAEAIAELVEAFPARLGAVLGTTPVLPPPIASSAHRWRYARVDRPLGEDAWWDPVQRLGACGDWCIDARIEAAFLSGRALAARMLAGALPR